MLDFRKHRLVLFLLRIDSQVPRFARSPGEIAIYYSCALEGHFVACEKLAVHLPAHSSYWRALAEHYREGTDIPVADKALAHALEILGSETCVVKQEELV